ncbi:MAG: hypothetical protein FWE34_02550 [Defluviitaleaceae bacterium]|nr:hypothetical protein [Defluviitaleaceae bacterium]
MGRAHLADEAVVRIGSGVYLVAGELPQALLRITYSGTFLISEDRIEFTHDNGRIEVCKFPKHTKYLNFFPAYLPSPIKNQG